MLHRLYREFVALESLISLSDQLILGVEGLVASHVGAAQNLTNFINK